MRLFLSFRYTIMDDFVITNLHESRNEWCGRLVTIMTPLVVEGFRSIFNEGWNMCVENDELGKYLMTFQELLVRVPKWNSEIIGQERDRIIRRSGCNYLEDLITCVHIIQLKVLTCIRVGTKQKQIDLAVPKLDEFIHKVYIHCARKIYSNVYLFEKNVGSLQQQKNARELEVIVQECIMVTIRDSIPTESIIRAYMDDAVEQEEEVVIEEVAPPPEPVSVPASVPEPELPVPDSVIPLPPPETAAVIPATVPETVAPVTEAFESAAPQEPTSMAVIPMPDPIYPPAQPEPASDVKFNDLDTVLNEVDQVAQVEAPKSIERLEELSSARELERQMEDMTSSPSDNGIVIHDENVHLTDFEDMSSSPAVPTPSEPHDDDIRALLGDIEEL